MVPFTGETFIRKLRSITLNREAYGLTGLVILFVTAGLLFACLWMVASKVFGYYWRASACCTARWPRRP